MNYSLELQIACARFDGAAEWNCAELPKLSKWLESGSPLDRARDALGQEQPPRNDIPVPCIHDNFNVLVQEIADDN